jgi:hypothetical protein
MQINEGALPNYGIVVKKIKVFDYDIVWHIP